MPQETQAMLDRQQSAVLLVVTALALTEGKLTEQFAQ
jgi:hypothetical protein